MSLARSGFKPKHAPRREPKHCTYTPRPREAACAMAPSVDRLTVSLPKFVYVRDERLRDMCRALDCQHCGRGGPDAGVTWAHSNQGQHGKGKSIKASDVFVAALCDICHRELDQGNRWTAGERLQVWDVAHRRTVQQALKLYLWPEGIPVPEFDDASCRED